MKTIHIIKIAWKAKKWSAFLKQIKKVIPGIKQEVKETKEMFSLIMKGKLKNKKVQEQSKDLLKLSVLGTIFMVPFIGSFLSGMILSKFSWIKMSAFKTEN